MKTHAAARAVCMLLAALLLLSSPPGRAAPFEINPLDPDKEELFYTYWMSGPERMLIIPARSNVEIYKDDDDLCILTFAFPGLETVFFAFFAIENPFYAGKDLSEYPDENVPEVLSVISSHSETLSFERYGEVAPGITAVWVNEESDGSKARHMVVFHQGWVFNSMAQTPDGGPVPPSAMDLQERLMLSMFQSGVQTNETWTVGNGVTLRVPESFLIYQPEEGSADYRFVSICANKTGHLNSLCVVYAVKSNMSVPDSVGLKDLSERERLTLLASSPIRMEEKIAFEEVEGHPDIMHYHAGGMEIYAALHGGALLLAVNLPRDDSQVWKGDFRLAALETMLGRETEWPVRVLPEGSVDQEEWFIRKEGSTMLIPSGENLLSLNIPEGYDVNIVRDEAENKILGLESRDGPLFILRVFPLGGPIAPLLQEGAEGRDEIIGKLTELFLKIAQNDAPDAKVKVEFREKGLLALPGGNVTDEGGAYLLLFCALDNNLVLFCARAERGRLPENIQDSLHTLLTFQPLAE